VRGVEHDGHVLGAVAEDGTSLLDEQAMAKSAIPREKVGSIVETARQSCRDEAIAVRGARWIIDVSNRTVVAVYDAPPSEWSAAVLATIFRKMGSHRILAAAPAISAAVIPSIARHVDEVVCVDRVQDPAMMAMLYRDRRDPSDREAVDLLSLQPKTNA
jgi:predicted phosphoribosyltransferase